MLAALAAILAGLMVGTSAQGEQWTLAVGSFGGTDQELQECYFQIGQGAMLTLHPKGEPCELARRLVGRTGKLIFVPDPLPIASPSR